MNYDVISEDELELYFERMKANYRTIKWEIGKLVPLEVRENIVSREIKIVQLNCPLAMNSCSGTTCAFNSTKYINSSSNPRIEMCCRFGGRDILIAKINVEKEEEKEEC